MWNTLWRIAEEIRGPWIAAGEWNEISSPIEQKGGERVNEGRCRKFREWTESRGLIDMEAKGPFYTWKGPKWQGLDRTYKRLDRCLCNVEWQRLFPDTIVKNGLRVCSDHHPLMTLAH